jgi:hypothetical protein
VKLPEQLKNPLAIADVQFVVVEAGMEGKQAPLVPARVSLRAEEVGAHIIVYAVDLPTQPAKIIDHLRTDQAG